MKVYDKAEWQIDGGVDKPIVERHFKLLFSWLNAKGLLSSDGKEIFELDSFGDVSLHSGLLTNEGNIFIDKNYDEIAKMFSYGDNSFVKGLDERYGKKILK